MNLLTFTSIFTLHSSDFSFRSFQSFFSLYFFPSSILCFHLSFFLQVCGSILSFIQFSTSHVILRKKGTFFAWILVVVATTRFCRYFRRKKCFVEMDLKSLFDILFPWNQNIKNTIYSFTTSKEVLKFWQYEHFVMPWPIDSYVRGQ